jgi:hypothetical protein
MDERRHLPPIEARLAGQRSRVIGFVTLPVGFAKIARDLLRDASKLGIFA